MKPDLKTAKKAAVQRTSMAAESGNGTWVVKLNISKRDTEIRKLVDV
jgi:hypothetical protein